MLRENVTCHMRARAIVSENKKYKTIQQLFLIKKKSRKILFGANEIFKNFPRAAAYRLLSHVSFFFTYKWSNIIGNHLHNNDQAKCLIEHENKFLSVSYPRRLHFDINNSCGLVQFLPARINKLIKLVCKRTECYYEFQTRQTRKFYN